MTANSRPADPHDCAAWAAVIDGPWRVCLRCRRTWRADDERGAA